MSHTLKTGEGLVLPLFSDLLLHDVSKRGSFGDGDATMTEFRTAPL